MDMSACPLGLLLAEINEKREDKMLKEKALLTIELSVC